MASTPVPPFEGTLAHEESKRTSFLELFFDLVFVFAITQIARTLHDDHSARGWLEAGLVMWLVWWAWSQYTWAANAIDLDRRPTRVAMLVVTGVTLLAAVSIPDAFTSYGAWFAVPYVLVRLIGLGLQWAGRADDPTHRAALRTYTPVAVVSPLVVLVGGLVDDAIRPWVWLAAVLIDVASVLAAGRGEFRVAPAHFAERHALIVIIAFGESVIAVGATAAGLPPTGQMVGVAAASFAVVASLWWAYFDWVQAAAEARLTSEADHRRRGRLARDLYTLAHLPIVAGTVVFAVGVEQAVLHPELHLDAFGLAAVAVGLGLYQVGFVVGNYRATRRVFVERVAALAGSVALVVLLGSSLSALALLVVLAGLLVATSARESVRRA